VSVRATRVGARSIRVDVRNAGPDTTRGLVARITLGDAERASGPRVLRSEAGTLRFAVPPLPPGAARSFNFALRG